MRLQNIFKILLVIILLVSNLNIFAEIEEYRGSLRILDDNKSWTEGEIKQIQLQIYPLQEVNLDDIKKKIQANDFCDFFYIGEVFSIEFSKNNPVVLEIVANATLKKKFNTSKPLIWSYLALNIPINLEQMILISQYGETGDFISLNVDRKIGGNYIYLIPLVLLILILILIFIQRKYNQKDNSIKELVELKTRILCATTRNEIENIYSLKKKIEVYFGINNPGFSNLFNIINQHQYKKDWDEDTLYEINFILDEIKESLRNG